MTILERIQSLFRRNVASIQTYEAIKGTGNLKYQDRLVSGGYHDFWDDYSRKEVVLNDAIGERVTLGFLKHTFKKLPKFVENDEVANINYIMDDVRQAIDTLNLKPKFITAGTNIVTNGWSILLWNLAMGENQKISGLSCKIFGYEECHPRYWIRFRQPSLVNKISHYRAIYIPRPVGMESSHKNLSEERYILRPTDPLFQHLTRIDYNYGYGFARIQPIWDAITKLRERSDSDHFLNSNYMEARYPQSWTKSGKAKEFVKKVRKATKRRGLAVEAVTNPQTNEDTGLPSVQYRPWGQGPQGQPMDKNRASAYLDGEWLRLLVNLGYSQIWAGGSTAGQEVGSEINLTRDDRADIAEFATLEPVFKKMLKRLAELGVMKAIGVSAESIERLMNGNYRMICWLTWEYNDKAAAQQAQLDHELEMKRGTADDRNAYDNNRSNLGHWITKKGKHIFIEDKNPDEWQPLLDKLSSLVDQARKAINEKNSKLAQIHLANAVNILQHRLKDRIPVLEYTQWGDKIDELYERSDTMKPNAWRMNPFAGYKDWDDCIAKNRDKDDPEAYCGYIKHKVEDKKNAAIRYNKQIELMLYNAIHLNKSMPMTPVMSSWIKKIGYDEGSLYMQVHDQTSQGINTYEYNPEDPEILWQEWIGSGSKGGFWWDYIRDVYSPAFKHGRPPDYLETGYGEELGFAQAEATREFKMYGELESGTTGVGTTRAPFPLPYAREGTPGLEYNPSELQIPESTAAGSSVYTPGRVFAPETVSGQKRVGPGRKRKPGRKPEDYSTIVPYNPTIYNSALITETFDEEIPKMLRLGKKVNWNMSKGTAYNFLGLVKHLNSHLWRCNSIAIGNEMSFDMPLYYENATGGVDVEYACPDAFKNVKNHIGNLYLYSNLAHAGIKVNVGTYERKGWDDKTNLPITSFDYDTDKIIALLLEWGKENSNIMTRLKAGLMPEMSTEYYCKPIESGDKILQTNIHNAKGKPIYEGIAIVDYGNCGPDHCKFTLLQEVT